MDEVKPADDNEELIAEGVRVWLVRWGSDQNKWTRSPVGRAMKEVLQKTGNWKNAPRGNPAKGFAAMNEKLQERA